MAVHSARATISRWAAGITAVMAASFVIVPTPTASAAAPDPAVLVGPSSGSTTSSASPTLQVRAGDPDGGPVEVTFEGRRKGATQAAAEPFGFVVIPDTQNYTYSGRQGTILSQAQWIVANRQRLDVAFVSQVGDLVSNWDNPTQWGHVSNGLRPLDDAGVPNSVLPGNHDFDNATGDFPLYDQFFPPSRYSEANWTPTTARYGGYLGQNQFGPDPVDRRNMNSYALFTAAGTDFLVLSLEWEAPTYALEWADRVLDAHPDRQVIMATHSFLTLSGARKTVAQRPGGTPVAQIWDTFVSTHCQIRLVVSGHESSGDLGEARRTDLNSCGKPVHSILTDYQGRANGGNGWLRYYTIDPTTDTLTATTYSPTLNLYETDDSSAFTLPFPLDPPAAAAPFTAIGSVTVESGTTASTTWPDLASTTEYEWRAVVRDPDGGSATSTTWTFTTPAPTQLLTDDFTRTVTGGWGTPPIGPAWIPSTAAAFSVSDGWGLVLIPKGAGRSIRPQSLRAADAVVETDLRTTTTPGGSGTFVGLLARENGPANYRAKIVLRSTGATTMAIVRNSGGVETTLASTTLSAPVRPGTVLRVRFEVRGSAPATLGASAWPVGTTAPSAWSLTATDSTAALAGPGGFGVDTYVSSAATTNQTVQFDRLSISPVAGTTEPPPANDPPVARISAPAVDGLAVSVDGRGSSDSDGSIVRWQWDFGDGNTAEGATASHTFASAGTYSVKLTATDDDQATATATVPVTVTVPPANEAPLARIAAPVVDGLSVSVDGRGSSDGDGSIVRWEWDFGDGGTAEGATASHTFASAGTYPVKLTVTDDDQATATSTVSVTVIEPPPPATDPVVDSFTRSATASWGTAETGGAWTVSGAADRFSVTGGIGRQALTAVGSTAEARLAGVALTGSETRVDLAWNRTGTAGKLYATVVPRSVSSSADYRVGVVVASTGRPTLNLIRRVGGVETTVATASPAVTVSANTSYRLAVRLQPSGASTVLSAKMWPVSGTEPTTWAVTATDGTASLQTAGSFRLSSYLSSSATQSVTTSFDNLRVVTV